MTINTTLELLLVGLAQAYISARLEALIFGVASSHFCFRRLRSQHNDLRLVFLFFLLTQWQINVIVDVYPRWPSRHFSPYEKSLESNFSLFELNSLLFPFFYLRCVRRFCIIFVNIPTGPLLLRLLTWYDNASLVIV